MANPQQARVSDIRSAKPPAPATQSGPAHEKIAIRAYEIWQESGRPNGKHEEHWYRAERELRARSR